MAYKPEIFKYRKTQKLGPPAVLSSGRAILRNQLKKMYSPGYEVKPAPPISVSVPSAIHRHGVAKQIIRGG